jgi:hypothetical protein
LEAAQAAIAEKRARQGGLPHGPATAGGRSLRAILSGLILVGVGVLIAQPTWLAGPGLPDEPRAVRAASATLALVEAVSRVSAFREVRGSLPTSLAEAGILNPDMRYERIGGQDFRVALSAGDSLVVLRSTDSLKPVVVNAILTLQRRS